MIKYDLSTHKTDKPIPFDRAFTLVIEKLSSKNIVAVHAYEAKFKDGKRKLVENSYIECNSTTGSLSKNAIKDITLKINPLSDTLQIFFPPLKPNIDFDINVIYGLTKECKTLLMKVNAQLSQGVPSAISTFNSFTNCTIDKINNRTYTSIDFSQYQTFYNLSLATHYLNISNAANYNTTATLSEVEIQAIDIVTSQHVSNFKNGTFLLEVSKRGLLVDIQLGNRDINKIFLPDADAATNLHFGNIRLLNLESNIKFFDSVFIRIDRVISKGILNVSVSGGLVDLNTTRTNLQTLRNNLQANYLYLKSEFNVVEELMDDEDRLRQGVYLSGNTVSSDLKTAGGNILFLDIGMANIVAPGLSNNAIYIPKLYWGISIYFRPIDKNTRRSKFPSKFDPPFENGCSLDPKTGLPVYGPDYGIVSKRSIWQHLSLTLGLTIGSMSNSDFDNFYNNTSLLIGPAYRFARAFKVSAGAALLRRTSKNPLVSEKSIVAAGYVSLSVDIDFIQSVKDATSILLK